MSEEKFYCPVYEDLLDEYGCSEISVGIHLGRFLDDGIPFLMDIETALERKHRCHACPRCPEHFRPKGLLPQQMLMHLGFPGDIKALEEALRQTENRFSDSSVVCHGGLVSRCQLPCGIQLWQEWDPEHELVHDVQPHFFSVNAMYLKADRIFRHGKPGKMVRNVFTAFARGRAKKDEGLVFSAFSSPDLCVYREDFVNEGDFIAQVTAFPAKLTCFDSVMSYKEKREQKLAEESFVSGLSMPGADEEKPGADALLTGIVRKVNKVKNDVTGLPFYHLELACLGLVFDVVADPGMFEKPPKPGNVLQGVFWLSARVLDYGYTGYDFEIDVTLPLTRAKFEPIRLAVSNLQPGERLYCGIDPPLGEMVYIRAKAEVEGISVEFRLDPQEEEAEEAEEADETEKPDLEEFRILRFYPVSRAMADKIFERTLVYCDPPSLQDARDVTAEYLDGEEQPAPEP